MKKKEIRSMNDKELKNMLSELRKDLIKLNAQVATGTQLKSPGQVRQIKKNIARVLTAQKNKEGLGQG
jgi:large subunit ribosomal protein L29